jgi:hypothetical protein
MEMDVATLSVVICLALAGLLIHRDSGAMPGQNPWRTGVLVVEAALWIAAATVVAPTLWKLLT